MQRQRQFIASVRVRFLRTGAFRHSLSNAYRVFFGVHGNPLGYFLRVPEEICYFDNLVDPERPRKDASLFAFFRRGCAWRDVGLMDTQSLDLNGQLSKTRASLGRGPAAQPGWGGGTSRLLGFADELSSHA
jgi:hypothetical protein